MHYSINEEERLVLLDLKNDLLELQKNLIINLIKFSTFSWRLILSLVYSFREYSFENMRTYGLKEILIRRALRFFGLTISEKRITQEIAGEGKSRSKTGKRGHIIRLVKLVSLPVYWLILFVLNIRRKYFVKNVKRNYFK